MPGPARPLEPAYRPVELEREVRRFWERSRAYGKVRRRPGRPFFFVDGPPYTTGAIHLGTAWNKVLKDAVLRYRTMSGFRVSDTPGWDMHGLPIEVKVEEELGFTSKKQIEEFGVGRFVARCRSFAMKNQAAMTRQFERLGVWMGWRRPYRTIEPAYMEAAWSTLKAAHEKGLLSQDYRIVNWCPRCETALAEAEVEYEEISDPSLYVKFPVAGRPEVSLLIWTTTPWTLPGNVAVALHPDAEYVEVRRGSETLIVAAPLAEKIPGLLGEGAETGARRRGRELAGLSYRHPLEEEVPRQREIPHRVVAAPFVTLEEGTGCVHIAPAFGEEDFRVGQAENLPSFGPVDERGAFTAEGGKYAGLPTRKANSVIIEDLRARGALHHSAKVSHRYGHCWRCKSPILFRATVQWFLKISELRDTMLAEAAKVKWVPAWAGSSRFADFIGEARDWCISRQRYWGIPLPIWRCGKCRRLEVVGSRAELQKRSGRRVADLHRPSVDPLTWRCAGPGCGGTMKRVPDIFDVWFDSAVASWAVQGWPAKRGRPLPSDFICEGHDQTRGWFFSQLGASVSAFGRAPYRTVLMHGFTLDEAGRKMSKSLGNVIEPGEVAERYGADALRWAVLSASAPWEDLRFSAAQAEGAFRSLNILYNAVRFLQGAKVPARAPGGLRVEDRWLLSRLQATVAEVTEELERFHLHKAARALQGFWEEDLSRWYIPLVRRRLGEGDPAAGWSLATSLDTAVRLLAPFAPFLAERLWGALPGRRVLSVHLAPWPKSARRQVRLEEAMAVARRAVEAAWRGRQRAERSLRWRVPKITFIPETPEVQKALHSLRGILGEQTNTEEVVILSPGSRFPDADIAGTLSLEVAGPVFKEKTQRIIEALRSRVPYDPGKKEDVFNLTQIGSGITLDIDGEKIEVPGSMFKIRPEVLPSYITMEKFDGGSVYVDGRLTPELETEGWAREVIRRVQETRKSATLSREQKIWCCLHFTDSKVARALKSQRLRQRIADAVLADLPARKLREEFSNQMPGEEVAPILISHSGREAPLHIFQAIVEKNRLRLHQRDWELDEGTLTVYLVLV